MDGNNRWSKINSLNQYNSYKKGAKKIIDLTQYIFSNHEVKFVSAFALSKNNLKRSKKIITLIKKILNEALENFDKDKHKFDLNFIGDFSFLEKKTQYHIDRHNNIEKFDKKLVIFLNYSGQTDIENASKKIKKFNNFKKNLSTNHLPNPDILIRTGGFSRISDFMLYQLAFTELFFLNKLWPDISKSDIAKIMKRYSKIDRKFGL